MKKQIFTILLLFSLGFYAKAQERENIIKGRFFITPFNGTYIVRGLAYERMLGKHFSAQLLYSFSTKEGDRQFQNSSFSSFSFSRMREFFPEIRYYFGERQNFKTNTFVGVYGVIRTKTADINDFFSSSSRPFNAAIKQKGLGLLVGQNLAIYKNIYFDVYVGSSYDVGTKETTLSIFKTPTETLKGFTARIGFNVCYRF